MIRRDQLNIASVSINVFFCYRYAGDHRNHDMKLWTVGCCVLRYVRRTVIAMRLVLGY